MAVGSNNTPNYKTESCKRKDILHKLLKLVKEIESYDEKERKISHHEPRKGHHNERRDEYYYPVTVDGQMARPVLTKAATDTNIKWCPPCIVPTPPMDPIHSCYKSKKRHWGGDGHKDERRNCKSKSFDSHRDGKEHYGGGKQCHCGDHKKRMDYYSKKRGGYKHSMSDKAGRTRQCQVSSEKPGHFVWWECKKRVLPTSSTGIQRERKNSWGDGDSHRGRQHSKDHCLRDHSSKHHGDHKHSKHDLRRSVCLCIGPSKHFHHDHHTKRKPSSDEFSRGRSHSKDRSHHGHHMIDRCHSRESIGGHHRRHSKDHFHHDSHRESRHGLEKKHSRDYLQAHHRKHSHDHLHQHSHSESRHSLRKEHSRECMQTHHRKHSEDHHRHRSKDSGKDFKDYCQRKRDDHRHHSHHSLRHHSKEKEGSQSWHHGLDQREHTRQVDNYLERRKREMREVRDWDAFGGQKCAHEHPPPSYYSYSCPERDKHHQHWSPPHTTECRYPNTCVASCFEHPVLNDWFYQQPSYRFYLQRKNDRPFMPGF